jgi:hypothetical protein
MLRRSRRRGISRKYDPTAIETGLSADCAGASAAPDCPVMPSPFRPFAPPSALTRAALEARIIGPATLAPAVGAPIFAGLLVLLLAALGRPPHVVDGAAGLVLEGVCPLGASIGLATLVGRDQALELALACPTPYRSVLGTRVAIVGGAGAALSVLLAIVLFAAGAWPAAQSPAGIVLAWAAPTVWLGGIGLLAAVASGSAGVGSGVIGGLWLAQILGTDALVSNSVTRAQYLYSTHIDLHGGAWIVNRAALVAVGAAAFAGAGALLRRPQRLLAGEAA